MMETIYDPLRKKEVARTPEEEVRQKMILWLSDIKGYSKNLMMSEYSFHFNGLLYRADIVVFDRERNIDILVECKAPSIPITRSVIEQGIRYNRVLKVRHIIFTNGITSCIYRRIAESDDYLPLKPNEF